MFSSNASQVSTAATYIEDVFSTYLYTGTGASQTVTNGIDLSTYGGFVWIKRRDGVNGGLFDTLRGTNNAVFSYNTNAQTVVSGALTSFGSNNFSVGASGLTNAIGEYASWTFRKQAKFFDVVTYTGDGSGFFREIPHSLNSQPGFVIIKRTDSTSNWWVTSRYSNGTYAIGNGTTDFALNSTNAASAVADATGPGGVFGSGTFKPAFIAQSTAANASGATYVAYLFAHDAGGFGAAGTDNVISCGSFTTDASGNATVSLGYEPQMLIAKRSDSTGNWILLDTMRGWINLSTGFDNPLFANSSQAESTGTFNYGNPTATGFDFSGGPASGTMIYIAIRRGPMKTPTSGTSVFETIARSGTSSAVTVGSLQSVDLSMTNCRQADASGRVWFDRLRGQVLLRTNTTGIEESNTNVAFDVSQGIRLGSDGVGTTVNQSGATYSQNNFRRAPGFFDVVCYTGTGANRTVSHNLGVAPELMIVKARTYSGYAVPWTVYTSALGNTKYIVLNTANGELTNSTIWNNTSPTASVFSVGTNDNVNRAADTYIAYLFATVAGVSKVGSYTGTAALQTINCGFTGGARFVLIKRTDSTGDWYVWDSARGISSGNDPYILLNSTAAEVTGTNYVDTTSVGFQVTAAAPAALNASGGSYIFWAVA